MSFYIVFVWCSFCLYIQLVTCSIYIVHDEVKDKHFEMELSWVSAATKGRHEKVPQDVYAEAERYAKSALEEDSDSENEDA